MRLIYSAPKLTLRMTYSARKTPRCTRGEKTKDDLKLKLGGDISNCESLRTLLLRMSRAPDKENMPYYDADGWYDYPSTKSTSPPIKPKPTNNKYIQSNEHK